MSLTLILVTVALLIGFRKKIKFFKDSFIKNIKDNFRKSDSSGKMKIYSFLLFLVPFVFFFPFILVDFRYIFQILPIVIMLWVISCPQLFAMKKLYKENAKHPSLLISVIIIFSNMLLVMFALLIILAFLVLLMDGTASASNELLSPKFFLRVRNFVITLHITFNVNKSLVIYFFATQYLYMYLAFRIMPHKYLNSYSDVLVKVGILITISSFLISLFSNDLYNSLGISDNNFTHEDLANLFRFFLQLVGLSQIIVAYLVKKKADIIKNPS